MISSRTTASFASTIICWLATTTTLLVAPSANAMQTLSPQPAPPVSGMCITDTPDESCGSTVYPDSCANVAKSNIWSGTCCSLSDVKGGCLLTVDGPGSTCSWSDTSGHDSMTVVIETTNVGTCPTTNYPVLDGIIPSQYKICLAASFAECAYECTQYTNNFGKTFQKCQQQDPTTATSCLNDAAIECNDAKGAPPTKVCQSLTTLRQSGSLRSGACQKLKLKCGTAAASATCYM